MENYLDVINFVKANKEFLKLFIVCNDSSKLDICCISLQLKYKDVILNSSSTKCNEKIFEFMNMLVEQPITINDISFVVKSSFNYDYFNLCLKIEFFVKDFRKIIEIFEIDVNKIGIFDKILKLESDIKNQLEEIEIRKINLQKFVYDLNICMEFI